MNDPLGGQAIAKDLERRGATAAAAAGPVKEGEVALYAARQ